MKKILTIILVLLISSTAFAAVVNWGGNSFTGLSSDTKPAASNGSRFYETNTLIPWLRVGGSWLHFALSLSDIGNPTADKTFNMATRSIQFTFTNPSNGPTFDGAFEIEATGAFAGDLLHVHQHTGNPGVGTDLVHFESEGADVTTLNIISGPSLTSIVADKKIIAGGFSTTGTVTAESASLTTPLAVTSGGTGTTCESFLAISSCTSHVYSSVTGTTALITLFTCTVPGGIMGTKGSLYTDVTYTFTGSSNAKTKKVTIGGTDYLSGIDNGATIVMHRKLVTMHNLENLSLQVGGSGASSANDFAGVVALPATSSINTASPFAIAVKCQLASAGEVCGILSVTTWVIRPICP